MTAASTSHRELILEKVAESGGPIDAFGIIQVVPSSTEVDVAVHVIRPNPKSGNSLILFTTGMSDRPMNIPANDEQTVKYRYAELVIALPPHWRLPEDGFRNDDSLWPIEWLLRIALFPHQHDSWLGGPFTIYARENPPRPVASNTSLSCMLLLADAYQQVGDEATGGASAALFSRVTCSVDKEVCFYSLLPLYTAERELEIQQGIGRLFELFDRHRIPLQVNINRANLAHAGK